MTNLEAPQKTTTDGARVRALRYRKGWTIDELCERLAHDRNKSVHGNHLRNIEAGRRNASAGRLHRRRRASGSGFGVGPQPVGELGRAADRDGRDFTKDLRVGVDTNRITDELERSRDNRIKYVIANGYIMSGDQGPAPWVWRRRPDGSDYGHHQHMHISVKSDARFGDDRRPWNIPTFGGSGTGQEEMLDDERAALFAIFNQVSGSWEPGQFPGWPSFFNDTAQTPVNYLRLTDRNINLLLSSTAKQEEALAALTTAVGQVHGVDADALLADVRSTIQEEIDSTTVNLSVRVNGQESSA